MATHLRVCVSTTQKKKKKDILHRRRRRRLLSAAADVRKIENDEVDSNRRHRQHRFGSPILCLMLLSLSPVLTFSTKWESELFFFQLVFNLLLYFSLASRLLTFFLFSFLLLSFRCSWFKRDPTTARAARASCLQWPSLCWQPELWRASSPRFKRRAIPWWFLLLSSPLWPTLSLLAKSFTIGTAVLLLPRAKVKVKRIRPGPKRTKEDSLEFQQHKRKILHFFFHFSMSSVSSFYCWFTIKLMHLYLRII